MLKISKTLTTVFLKSTEEVALGILPKKKGRGQGKPSNSPTIAEAKKNFDADIDYEAEYTNDKIS